MNGAEPVCGSKAYPTTTTTTTTSTSTTTSTTPPLPATTTTSTTWGYPSFFCCTVVRSNPATELQIVRRQLFRRTGIFACEEYAVYSDFQKLQKIGIGPDGLEIMTVLIPSVHQMAGATGDMPQANTCTSAITSLTVWDLIKQDGRYRKHHWTVKVDPNVVFLPDRIKPVLKKHTTPAQSLYVMNCNKNGNPQMLQALEVLSRKAMESYAVHHWKCKTSLKWRSLCEARFMAECLDQLGVTRLNEWQMLGDSSCTYAACSDGRRVAFQHDYQDERSWNTCFEEAIGR